MALKMTKNIIIGITVFIFIEIFLYFKRRAKKKRLIAYPSLNHLSCFEPDDIGKHDVICNFHKKRIYIYHVTYDAVESFVEIEFKVTADGVYIRTIERYSYNYSNDTDICEISFLTAHPPRNDNVFRSVEEELSKRKEAVKWHKPNSVFANGIAQKYNLFLSLNSKKELERDLKEESFQARKKLNYIDNALKYQTIDEE
jgi:hypothetical protein